MNMNEWTAEDQENALSQGWGIFQNMDSKALEIQKNDEFTNELVQCFESDEEALKYVQIKAEKGRGFYRRAMKIIGKPLPFANFETFLAESAANIAPPIGLMPKSIWMKLRLKDIKEAVKRFESAGKEIPKEWIEEAGELALKLEDWE